MAGDASEGDAGLDAARATRIIIADNGSERATRAGISRENRVKSAEPGAVAAGIHCDWSAAKRTIGEPNIRRSRGSATSGDTHRGSGAFGGAAISG